MTREYRGARRKRKRKASGARSAEASGAEAEVEKVKRQTCNLSGRLVHSKRVDEVEAKQESNGEFDPGSGRTLAACLTHASRTEIKISVFILVAHG